MDSNNMDSASDHSSHASSASPVVAIKPSSSPSHNNNNLNMSNNHNHQIHSPRQASPLCPPMTMGHNLSPPPVSSASLARSMTLGQFHPPGLGLLNSLGAVLHNPLDLMAAHHGPPRSYNSPPPISTSDPTANECKLVDYRGQKVAAFIIAGDTMLCLPQAFELFLKHLVGGLHTVYTKLKRLDIVPLVCNVEQVRILRGLGAIQPGVNRCKLLSCKDFDTLFKDCTTARPGRPPKRAPVGLSLAASHLQHPQLKKQRLDNGDYPYENGHLNDMARLEKSPLLANGYNHPPHLGHMQFMQMPHPAAAHSALLSPAMPHNLSRHDGSVIKNQGMPSMEAIARAGVWENCRAAYEDIVKHLERLREERGDPDRPICMDQKARDLSPRNGSPTDHSPVLNLSKSGGGSAGSMGDGDHSGSEADGADIPPSPRSPRSAVEDEEDDNISDPEDDEEKDQDLEEGDVPVSTAPSTETHHHNTALNYSSLASAVASANGQTPDSTLSSTETLLRNIQGLLKVAADNARQQERQINYEKAELKMDLLREREMKEGLQRQLHDEQKKKELHLKRFRRERRSRRQLEECLELEKKHRVQLEDALKNAGGSEEIRRINENFQTIEAPQKASTSSSQNQRSSPNSQEKDHRTSSTDRLDRMKQEPISSPPMSYPQSLREQPPTPQQQLENKPSWCYSSLDLMNNATAFWNSYSDSLAQELEMERKNRQQQMEREEKSPLQDRSSYYKNSVLFTSSAT